MMELDSSFLAEPLSQRKFTQRNRDAQKRVTTMTVANDAAEKGIKCPTKFFRLCKSTGKKNSQTKGKTSVN